MLPAPTTVKTQGLTAQASDAVCHASAGPVPVPLARWGCGNQGAVGSACGHAAPPCVTHRPQRSVTAQAAVQLIGPVRPVSTTSAAVRPTSEALRPRGLSAPVLARLIRSTITLQELADVVQQHSSSLDVPHLGIALLHLALLTSTIQQQQQEQQQQQQLQQQQRARQMQSQLELSSQQPQQQPPPLQRSSAAEEKPGPAAATSSSGRAAASGSSEQPTASSRGGGSDADRHSSHSQSNGTGGSQPASSGGNGDGWSAGAPPNSAFPAGEEAAARTAAIGGGEDLLQMSSILDDDDMLQMSSILDDDNDGGSNGNGGYDGLDAPGFDRGGAGVADVLSGYGSDAAQSSGDLMALVGAGAGAGGGLPVDSLDEAQSAAL
ncbi:hypothetical protein Agub_g4832, partial [Astrephomene gubernaculifera]